MENNFDNYFDELLDIEDTALSYNEWKSNGLYVRKGEKSKLRDPMGIPQFCIQQVIGFEPKTRNIIINTFKLLTTESKEIFINHMKAKTTPATRSREGISIGELETPTEVIDNSNEVVECVGDQIINMLSNHIDDVGGKHHPNMTTDCFSEF